MLKCADDVDALSKSLAIKWIHILVSNYCHAIFPLRLDYVRLLWRTSPSCSLLVPLSLGFCDCVQVVFFLKQYFQRNFLFIFLIHSKCLKGNSAKFVSQAILRTTLCSNQIAPQWIHWSKLFVSLFQRTKSFSLCCFFFFFFLLLFFFSLLPLWSSSLFLIHFFVNIILFFFSLGLPFPLKINNTKVYSVAFSCVHNLCLSTIEPTSQKKTTLVQFHLTNCGSPILCVWYPHIQRRSRRRHCRYCLSYTQRIILLRERQYNYYFTYDKIGYGRKTQQIDLLRIMKSLHFLLVCVCMRVDASVSVYLPSLSFAWDFHFIFCCHLRLLFWGFPAMVRLCSHTSPPHSFFYLIFFCFPSME